MRKISVLFCLLAGVTFCYAQKDSLVTRVYFDVGKFNLSGSATQELDKLIPEITKLEKIKITGQTDALGSHTLNDPLSLNRANEVYNYLVKKGIDPALAHEIIGYGKRNLIASEGTSKANENELNRVVVITSYLKKQAVEPTQVQKPQKSFEQQLKEGSSNIVLNNLNFNGGRHTLLPTAIPVLESILETMKKFPTLEIEIQGHICCLDGSMADGIDLDTNEQTLSVNRAKAVFDYLVANGINAGRMTYKGFGARNRLVSPEKGEADYATNRRVEFKIVKQ